MTGLWRVNLIFRGPFCWEERGPRILCLSNAETGEMTRKTAGIIQSLERNLRED